VRQADYQQALSFEALERAVLNAQSCGDDLQGGSEIGVICLDRHIEDVVRQLVPRITKGVSLDLLSYCK
jgi:hypothetical protein